MRINTLVICLVVIVLAKPHQVHSFEGPLHIKNGHPLYSVLNSPSLISAEPSNSLVLDFSYSSTYLVEQHGGWQAGIDLETARLDLQLSSVARTGTELGIGLPVIRYGSGFMDNGIGTYHRMLGMSDAYGRNDRPRNDFLFQLGRDGNDIIHGEPNRTALGDLSVWVKQAVVLTGNALISIQAFLNVPTGDADAGYGSGQSHGGLAFLMNEPLGESILLYVNIGYGTGSTLKALRDIGLKPSYFGGIGLEWQYTRRVCLNIQMITQSSPYPATGIRSLDDPSLLASIGGSYSMTDKSALGISITEDPDTAGAPDIMAGVDYRYRF